MNIRNDFPILESKNLNELVFFDNASTTQKPKMVIDAIVDYYSNYNANIHRGSYIIAEKSTKAYELVRNKIAQFINADQDEIIFTSGTTQSINFIAYSYGNSLKDGDEIIISEMEHHSNIVPWQMLLENKKIILKYIPILSNGELDIKKLNKMISKKTKLISIIHMSNIIGTINPIEHISKIANKNKIPILIDAAQSIAHQKIDVKKINCDFLVFSGHKMMGPTGVGILYISKNISNSIAPFLRGGHMIKTVLSNSSTWNDIPWKFEAGTGNIAQVIGLGNSIEYIEKIGLQNIHKHTQSLLLHLLSKLNQINGITIYGHQNNSGPIVSFNIKDFHPYDIAKLLDKYGICIRAGHHCGQILMNAFNTNFTCRVSLYAYNSISEIDYFIDSLNKVINILEN